MTRMLEYLSLALSSLSLAYAEFPFPASQLQALQDLYIALDGPNWRWSQNTAIDGIPWDFTVPDPNPCTAPLWQYVTCSSDCLKLPCSVTILYLVDIRINGELPASIGDLTSLRELFFGENLQLTGTIPTTIGSLTALEVLALYGNGLTGTIPTAIGALTSLQSLDLSFNRLHGSIPSSIGDLNSIKAISFEGNNHLDGPIPPSLFSLPELRSLVLAYNLLSGGIPSTINKLVRLEMLNVESNSLSGTIPETIGELTALQFLTLSGNALEGTIPDSIGNLAQLKALYNTGNLMMHGALPPSISALTKLEVLDISINRISGSLPLNIGDLSALTEMDLSESLLSGTLPATFTELRSLRTLELSYTSLSGSLPEKFGELGSLRSMDLTYSQFRGRIPTSLSALQSLENFAVSQNFFSGTIPDSFGALTSLRSAVFSGNLLSGTIPSTMGNLVNLEELDISENTHINGTIPEEIGRLRNLRLLSLSNNSLSGSIPQSLADLSSLETLSLSRNLRLSGSIPDSLGSLQSLRYLFLSFNDLSGPIPESIGDMLSLVRVELSFNSLTGTIPATIGNIAGLKVFNVERNDLVGGIPSEIGLLTKLIHLSAGFNHLTGSIPNKLSALTDLNTFLFSGNRLTGTLPSELGDLESLVELLLVSNLLTGTLPTSLSSLRKLEYLYLSDNMFNESIPDQWASMISLEQLYLDDNFLSGSIPDSLSNLTSLEYLYLSKNILTGSFPSGIAAIQSLAELRASDNLLTGALPRQLLDLPLMEVLNMSGNFFSGNISSSTSDHAQGLLINTIDYSSNLFSGRVDALFSSIPALGALFLQNNIFTGSITNLTDAALQRRIQNIDIGFNQFSGRLPTNIWSSKSLTTFAAVKNCLQPALPTELCDAKSLQILALDGLHAAEACVIRIFPAVSSLFPAYILPNYVRGQLLECLFLLPNLTTLHLGGNQLTGSLPTQISEQLVDVALSHNLLTGSIPRSFQQRVWQNFDVSFNRLRGHLLGSFHNQSSNSSIKTQINRLSGQFPQSIKSLQQIDVLAGNLFSCGFSDRQSELPIHDPAASSYQCGSNTVDTALYLCVVVVLCVLAAAGMVWSSVKRRGVDAEANVDPEDKAGRSSESTVYSGQQSASRSLFASQSPPSKMSRSTMAAGSMRPTSKSFRMAMTESLWNLMTSAEDIKELRDSKRLDSDAGKWSSEKAQEEPVASLRCVDLERMKRNIEYMHLHLRQVRTGLLYYALGTSAVLFIVYPTLSAYYKQYQDSYAWVISIAFLTGITPAVALLLILIGVLLCLLYGRRACASLVGDRAQADGGGKDREEAKEDADAINATVDGSSGTSAISAPSSLSTSPDSSANRSFLRRLTLVCWGTVLFVCIIAINGAYVYGLTLHEAGWVTRLLEAAMSVWKLIWTRFVVLHLYPALALSSGSYLCQSRGYQTSLAMSVEHDGDFYMQSLVMLAILSDIIAPLLADALFNPSCFYYALTNPPAVTESYSYGVIDLAVKESDRFLTVVTGTSTTTFIPAFTYSYQCSSQLLVNYLVVYIYRDILGGLLVPLAQYVMRTIAWYRFREYGAEDAWLRWLQSVLPLLCTLDIFLVQHEQQRQRQATAGEGTGMMREEERKHDDAEEFDVEEGGDGQRSSSIHLRRLSVNPLHSLTSTARPSAVAAELANRTTESPRESAVVSEKRPSPAVDTETEGTEHGGEGGRSGAKDPAAADNSAILLRYERRLSDSGAQLTVLFAVDMAIFSILGPLFPPLLLLGWIVISLRVKILQVLFRQGVQQAMDGNLAEEALVRSWHRVSATFLPRLLVTTWIIAQLAALLWAFFLFDILGDAVGAAAAAWIPVVMFCVPLVVRCGGWWMGRMPGQETKETMDP